VEIRLVEANPVTASLLFDLVEGGVEGAGGRPGRGRPTPRGRGPDRDREKKGKPKQAKDKRSRRR
jgi:hypothetical protein